ncbi:hypothetical protein SAMN06297387_104151 [Streptomyces zhaozhouensis]|uniref:Integral membrane protein n=1 Tax=Streptomyces zhaozhouensis TaxID=1300267 RepID=A0A286DTK8_9ACTN|nr:DUF6350 family protein [Streptomyces zhaozhouensis]SOD61981.1 hypothetical protein SAMN06297387_104151 [Streptomyces zhaozhouensis]
MRHLTQSALRRTAPPGRAQGRWFLEGMLAAGLGLGGLAVLVLLFWVLSPYPDHGATGALRIAADLWLLAHGCELVRHDTLYGGTAPVGLTPLLLAALPVWLLHRAVRVTLRPDPEDAEWAAAPGEAFAVARWLCAGYLLTGAAAAVFASPADLAPGLLSTALQLPLFAVLVTVVSAWVLSGVAPWTPPDGWRAARWAGPFTAERLAGAGRAALGGAAACCGVGALLAAGALLLHASAAQGTLVALSGDWSGRLAVLLLGCALAPNAAVWGAAYGLGPGFTLGGGSLLSPLAVSGEPVPPPFPLLAGLPHGTPDGVLLWCTAAVPLAGVLVIAGLVARWAVPVPGERGTAAGWWGTALTALLAAAGTGLLLGWLGTLAGGPLGAGELAQFGPHGWLTGAVAAGWALAALPVAWALRLLRLHQPRLVLAGLLGRERPGARVRPRPPRRARRPAWPRRRRRREEPVPEWHTTDARLTRWSALRKSSGELVSRMDDHR